MNPVVLFMMSDAKPPVSAGEYVWDDGDSGDRSVVWHNPNATAMTLTLDTWSGGKVSWVTASPQVVAARGSVTLTATKAISSGVVTTDMSFISWTCQGTNGVASAEASYYEP